VSPAGNFLVISDQSQGDRKSLIYTLPITGGKPKLITETGPSYWHGWSPDGKTLAYCAERKGKYDIYTIPATGGEETRTCTSLAPPSRSRRTIGPMVLPRTIESSISTTRLPARLAASGLNFK